VEQQPRARLPSHRFNQVVIGNNILAQRCAWQVDGVLMVLVNVLQNSGRTDASELDLGKRDDQHSPLKKTT